MPRNSSERHGIKPTTVQDLTANGAIATSSRPHRTVMRNSFRPSARFFHQVHNHSQVRNRQSAVLFRSNSFHSCLRSSNLSGSWMISTVVPSGTLRSGPLSPAAMPGGKAPSW